jgi:sulfite exporter TauE/SafE
LSGQLPVRSALYLLANLMLIALGLYLMGVTGRWPSASALGQKLWRHLQPLTRRFLPARTAAQAFPLGLLWGWLPCGLVYSALATALTSGSAWHGAGLMLAFGVGTLPNLLLAGLLALACRPMRASRWSAWLSGLLILGFGVWGLMSLPGWPGWCPGTSDAHLLPAAACAANLGKHD